MQLEFGVEAPCRRKLFQPRLGELWLDFAASESSVLAWKSISKGGPSGSPSWATFAARKPTTCVLKGQTYPNHNSKCEIKMLKASVFEGPKIPMGKKNNHFLHGTGLTRSETCWLFLRLAPWPRKFLDRKATRWNHWALRRTNENWGSLKNRRHVNWAKASWVFKKKQYPGDSKYYLKNLYYPSNWNIHFGYPSCRRLTIFKSVASLGHLIPLIKNASFYAERGSKIATTVAENPAFFFNPTRSTWQNEKVVLKPREIKPQTFQRMATPVAEWIPQTQMDSFPCVGCWRYFMNTGTLHFFKNHIMPFQNLTNLEKLSKTCGQALVAPDAIVAAALRLVQNRLATWPGFNQVCF